MDYYRCDPCGHVWTVDKADPDAPPVHITQLTHDVRELHVLASLVADGYPGVAFVSVAASDGGAESVELLMSVERADQEVEPVVMRVPRNRQRFEAELRRQIEALPNR